MADTVDPYDIKVKSYAYLNSRDSEEIFHFDIRLITERGNKWGWDADIPKSVLTRSVLANMFRDLAEDIEIIE